MLRRIAISGLPGMCVSCQIWSFSPNIYPKASGWVNRIRLFSSIRGICRYKTQSINFNSDKAHWNACFTQNRPFRPQKWMWSAHKTDIWLTFPIFVRNFPHSQDSNIVISAHFICFDLSEFIIRMIKADWDSIHSWNFQMKTEFPVSVGWEIGILRICAVIFIFWGIFPGDAIIRGMDSSYECESKWRMRKEIMMTNKESNKWHPFSSIRK